MEVKRVAGSSGSGDVAVEADESMVLMMDFAPDADLAEKALGRELVNRVQRLRKTAGLQPTDGVLIWVSVEAPKKKMAALGTVAGALAAQRAYVEGLLRKPVGTDARQGHEVVLCSDTWTADSGEVVTITITKVSVRLLPALLKLPSGKALGQWLSSYEVEVLAGKGTVTAVVDGTSHALVRGTHFAIPE